jgi:hypothetical protein
LVARILQAARPYFSPDDVAKGSRWSAEIAKELDMSRIGILVITPENQEAAWLLFEAGALAQPLASFCRETAGKDFGEAAHRDRLPPSFHP